MGNYWTRVHVGYRCDELTTRVPVALRFGFPVDAAHRLTLTGAELYGTVAVT